MMVPHAAFMSAQILERCVDHQHYEKCLRNFASSNYIQMDQFRAPEEYAFLEENEMIDIYSMGNIFYAILSGNMPFEGQKESKAQKKVMDGIRPKIPKEVMESDDVAIQTLLSVTKRCWSKKPNDRPSAATIRDELKELLDGLVSNNVNGTVGPRGM